MVRRDSLRCEMTGRGRRSDHQPRLELTTHFFVAVPRCSSRRRDAASSFLSPSSPTRSYFLFLVAIRKKSDERISGKSFDVLSFSTVARVHRFLSLDRRRFEIERGRERERETENIEDRWNFVSSSKTGSPPSPRHGNKRFNEARGAKWMERESLLRETGISRDPIESN